MQGVPMAVEMLAQVMDLGMAVMTRGDGIVGAGGHDLFGLQAPVFTAGLGKSRLQEAAAAAAAVVVGTVGGHVDEVLFAHGAF